MNARGDQARPPTLDWIREQPKAELHVHLLGAMRPATAFELAALHGHPPPCPAPSDWVRTFTTGSLFEFVERFIGLFPLLRTAEDFERVALEAFEDMAADGIAYAEPRVTLTSHLSRGVAIEAISEGLSSAAREAHRKWGIEVGWIVDFPRVLGIETGRLALNLAVEGRRWGVVGFDIAGYEGTSEEDSAFVRLFREARESGLGLTAHAGETGPSEHVRVALEEWRVERIGHGVRAVDDPGLVSFLAERGVPLEVCPSANVALGASPSLAEHPVDQLLRAGVRITLNTDDPSLFGVTLSEEIHRVATTFGWTQEQVSEVIGNGWKGRFGRR